MGKLEEKIALITGGNSGIGLGIVDGRLAPCPNKPNCVSSQAAASDKQHYIEGLTYSGGPAHARERLDPQIASHEDPDVCGALLELLSHLSHQVMAHRYLMIFR